MQIVFKTKNFKLTKKIKKYIQDRLLKFNRQLPDSTFIEINLEDIYGPKGGKDKKVHLSVDTPGEEYLHLEEQTSDIFASIDLVFKKFAQKIHKVKGKFLAKRRKQRFKETFSRVTGWMPKNFALNLTFKKTKNNLKIEKEIRKISEILDDLGALEKLKKSGKSFYLFRSRDTKKLNLICREAKAYKIFEIQ